MLKELLIDAHILYCLACGLPVGQIPIHDESTLSSANDGPVVSLQESGTALPLSVSLHPHAVVMSVHRWSCISREWAEMFHRIGHLDSLQYKHILQNVMLSSVLSKTPLIRWNNPVPARRLFRSRNSFCSGIAIAAGRYRTH